MDFQDAEKMGFATDVYENFDPNGGIVNKGPGQSEFLAASLAQSAKFTLNAVNAVSTSQIVEFFGAANSIVEIPNDAVYSSVPTTSGAPYRPCTIEQIMCLIGNVASTAEASEGAIVPANMVIYDDRSGNMVWINCGTTGTPYFPLSQWATFFTSQSQLLATTSGVAAIVSCQQRPYRAFMKDLLDMVLKISLMKFQYTTTTGLNNVMTLQRPKSFGGADSNTIEPSIAVDDRSFNAYRATVEDVFYIDKLTTIYMPVDANSTVNIAFYVSAFRNNGAVI